MNDLSTFVDGLDNKDPNWTDQTTMALITRVQEDYIDMQRAEETAKAVVASFEQYIPYARDFRLDNGIDLESRLDATQTMDAKLAKPVTDMQSSLRAAAEYLDKGKYHENAADFARALQECGEHGSKDCKRACEAAGNRAFGASFDDFLESCQTALEKAPEEARQREQAKAERYGFKDYALQTLATYGQFTGAQKDAFTDSVQAASDDTYLAYNHKVSERDKLYAEAQREDREKMEFGDDSFHSAYDAYMRYNENTDYDAETKAFFEEYASVYTQADSSDARRQLDKIMHDDIKRGKEWDEVKASLPGSDGRSAQADLTEAFADKSVDEPHYDAWEQEHLDDLF